MASPQGACTLVAVTNTANWNIEAQVQLLKPRSMCSLLLIPGIQMQALMHENAFSRHIPPL